MDASVIEFQVRQFEISGGGRIFQIPMLEFPGLSGYAYLVLLEDASGTYRVLIDSGSGFGESNQQLEAGLQVISGLIGEPLGFPDLTHILITHGHIDHFGGLTYVRPRTPALIGVHELDLRNLTNYEERLTVAARRLDEFLRETGVSTERRLQLIKLYKSTKSLSRSVRVDFTYEAIGMRLGPFEMLHVPGHCAGHVVIRLYDVLFSGDHVLQDISPHQSPEHLTLSTGLDHYLKSLDLLQPWAEGIRLTLGGHKEPITDLNSRIEAIRQVHAERLGAVLGLLEQPHTVLEISQALFGEVHGYNALLALEEAGAHVEYLYQRGQLGIDNLDELESNTEPAPIRYRCLPRYAG
jgi:glyoxylase-like metal-dependent hydrolase (beta-lactamase superfamily II)